MEVEEGMQDAAKLLILVVALATLLTLVFFGIAHLLE